MRTKCLLILVTLLVAASRPASAQFDLAWSTPWQSSNAVSWADWDGDGDDDLIIGGDYIRIYRNDSGTLVLAWTSTTPGKRYSLAWHDYDGDGDLDLAAGNSGTGNGAVTRIYQNQGGTMTEVWSGHDAKLCNSFGRRSVSWHDFDDDGDLDLTLACNHFDMGLWVYPNVAGVIDTNHSVHEFHSSRGAMWGDLDGDGIDEWVTASAVYKKVGGGIVLDVALASPASDIELVDFDGDGDLDVALTHGGLFLYANNGGTIDTVPRWSDEQTTYWGMAWADWDMDGDMDVAVAADYEPTRIFSNDGSGTFQLTWMAKESDGGRAVAWGDLDGDGDLDLAVTAEWGVDRLYRNSTRMLIGPPDPRTSWKRSPW